MKHQIIEIICVALVLCAGAHANQGLKIDRDYNLVPDEQDLADRRAFYFTIEDAVKSVLDKGPTDFQAILEGAKQLAPTEPAHSLEAMVYKTLVNVASDEPACKPSEVELIHHLFAMSSSAQYNETVAPISGYLLHFGPKKLANCAEKAERDFVARSKVENGKLAREFSFNEFIRLMTPLDGQADDAALYKAAKKFNLAKAIKTRASRHRLRAFAVKQLGAYNEIVFHLMNNYCSALRRTTNNIMDIVNLAQAFGTYKMRDQKLLKYNEFHRIFCVTSRQRNILSDIREIDGREIVLKTDENPLSRVLNHVYDKLSE